MGGKLHSSPGHVNSVVDITGVIPIDENGDHLDEEVGKKFRSGFPAGFKRARVEAGLTQVEFSKISLNGLGEFVSLESVHGWEQGRHLPRVDTIEKLCRFFGCSLNYLFGQTDHRNPDDQMLHEATGLDEAALQNLRTIKDDELAITALNYVLSRMDFIRSLVTLFASEFFSENDIKFNASAIWDSRFDAKKICLAHILDTLDDMLKQYRAEFSDDPKFSSQMVFRFLQAYADIHTKQDIYSRVQHESYRYTDEQLSYAVRFLLRCGFEEIMRRDKFDFARYICEE